MICMHLDMKQLPTLFTSSDNQVDSHQLPELPAGCALISIISFTAAPRNYLGMRLHYFTLPEHYQLQEFLNTILM